MKSASVIIILLLIVSACSRVPSQPKKVKIENFDYSQARHIIDGQKKTRERHFKGAKKQRKQELREVKYTHRS